MDDTRQQLRVADVLRQYAPGFVREHRSQAAPQVHSTLAKLSLCRTAPLGGHLYQCCACNHRTVVYNSCGDRHCPQCSGARRRSWLDSSAELLLPGVDYFQVVFTIPAELSSLALGNRRAMYNLLFQSAWRALKETIEDEQQFEAAAAMVLHTWNQKLDAHIHVHALVPGGGPSLKNPGTWKSAAPPPHLRHKRLAGERVPRHDACSARPAGAPGWLVDPDELRLAFRTQFLAGLRRLHKRGALNLTGDWSSLRGVDAFEEWLKPLTEISWVTYIQAPPKTDASPEHVLKYLARYMTGGPISDRRIVAHVNGKVTFTARSGTQRGGSTETEEVVLSGEEFVRRWCLHILPKGFTKSRCYGGYSNRHRGRYLEECRKLLSIDEPENASVVADEAPEESAWPRCSECASAMHSVSGTDRPGWSVVMHGPLRPRWYDDG